MSNVIYLDAYRLQKRRESDKLPWGVPAACLVSAGLWWAMIYAGMSIWTHWHA